MTISDLMQQLQTMKQLTGKQCSAYECGPMTYNNLKSVLLPKEPDSIISNLRFSGVRIIQSDRVPDDGKFYPMDYLEQMK